MSNTDNTLPEELKAQISDEAASKAISERKHHTLTDRIGYQAGYIAGATEYAQWKVKCEQAHKLLERLMDNHNATLPSEALFNEIKSFLDGTK